MTSVPRRRRVLFAAVAFLGSLGLGLGALELGVRLWWQNMPDAVYPDDTGCCGGRTLRPNVVGHDLYHRFRHNSLGYRGPEHAPRGAGPLRVAVVGDSFVYGVAVDEAGALPGRLGAALQARAPGAEVINAGMPGNTLEMNLARARDVLTDYAPDVVVLVLLYNDFEATDARGGAAVEVAPVRAQGQQNALGRVAEWLLPRVDPGDPRFAIGRTPPADIAWRYAIARRWRTWMYLGLELRRHGTDWERPSRDLTLLHLRSRQVDAVAWDRLRDTLQGFSAACAAAGARPAVAWFLDGPLEGIPALRLREAVAESGVPFVDLAPLWGDMPTWWRRYTFRFDGHPNRVANDAAARLIDHSLAHAGVLPGGGAADAAVVEAHAARVAAHRARQEALAGEQQARLDALAAGFGPRLSGREGRGPAAEAQWIFGGVEGDPSRGYRGLGMGSEIGFFLRAGAEGAGMLEVTLARAPGADPALAVEATCEGASAGPAQSPPASGPATLRFPLAAPAAPGALLECRLALPGAGLRDALTERRAVARPATFVLDSVALAPAPGAPPG
jgi:lysophospholipase L1-like esterase